MSRSKIPSARIALLLTRSLLGTITLLGMLVGFDSTRENVATFLVALFVTNLSLTLTRFHAESINVHIQSGRRPNFKERWQILTDSALVMIPTLIPILILVARWLHLIPNGTAIFIAKCTAIAVLFLIGYLSSRLVGGTYLRATLIGLGDMTLGLVIVFLNYLF